MPLLRVLGVHTHLIPARRLLQPAACKWYHHFVPALYCVAQRWFGCALVQQARRSTLHSDADSPAQHRTAALVYCMQGPMPNKVPGKLGDPYPAFLATHATDAYGHAQAALRHNHAALGASQLEMARVRKDKLFIEALAGRFKKGAAALKADKWREHEAK